MERAENTERYFPPGFLRYMNLLVDYYSLRVFGQVESAGKILESRNFALMPDSRHAPLFWGGENGETCVLAGDSDGTEP
jgi:hypothetical protein